MISRTLVRKLDVSPSFLLQQEDLPYYFQPNVHYYRSGFFISVDSSSLTYTPYVPGAVSPGYIGPEYNFDGIKYSEITDALLKSFVG